MGVAQEDMVRDRRWQDRPVQRKGTRLQGRVRRQLVGWQKKSPSLPLRLVRLHSVFQTSLAVKTRGLGFRVPKTACSVDAMADRDWGAKAGSGGVASDIQAKVDRRERLRQLALQTVDLQKDPYFMRNHLGTYECKLCLTLHNNEGNYLAHTQGKRHQQNLARRAAKEARDNPVLPQAQRNQIKPKKSIKIGRPGYRVTKQLDPETQQRSLLFEVDFPRDRLWPAAKAPLHVRLRAEGGGARSRLAVPAVCCGAV